MKKIGMGLVFMCLCFYNHAQSTIIEEKDGKKCYVHIVEGGNTLYNLSKLYNIDADKIVDFNPGSEKGIQIGQKLYIPVEGNAVEIPEQTIEIPAKHTVQKGDNLYNISKRYGVSMEDIVKLNPGSENAINIGQDLALPTDAKVGKVVAVNKTQVVFSDSIVEYTVLPHETLYTISKRFMVSVDEIKKANNLKSEKLKKNEVIKIPVKKEKITKVEVRKVEQVSDQKVDESLSFKSKSNYKIVYLLPFGLDGGSESLKGISTEFLMGSQLALDSLEKMGLSAEVLVLDVSPDTVKFKKMLDEKVKNADLIIGPFMGTHVDIAALFAKKNKIRMVSPLNQSTTYLKDNPFVYNAVNSDITLMQSSAKYLVQKHVLDQIVLVKPDSKDDELYQSFRLAFNQALSTGTKVKLMECGLTDLGNYIRKGGNTIFVVPSRDKGFTLKFISALEKVSAKAGNGKIMIFGTKDWANNDDLKGYYKNKYSLHFATPYDFNYTYDDTKKILKKYRQKYNADLSKYGVQGFDVSLFFIGSFLLNSDQSKVIMNQFNVQKTATGSGFENKACYILRQENFELIQAAFINE